MYSLSTDKVIPKIPLEPDPRAGNRLFKIRNYDSIVHYRKAELLQPHRKDFYFMAFVREGSSRHWVDMTPYVFKPNTIYFSTPHQVHVKEDAIAITGTIIAFGEEFLALDDTNFLKSLPLIRNPHNGHELNLMREDVLFLEGMLDKIEAESLSDRSWKNQMLLAYLKVLLIYLSRLYTEQYDSKETSPDRVLLKRFLSKINESYQSLHEVADYAALLNISAGHLGEVIKAQSGKPAITLIHERLLMEARRSLVHTELAVKEIAYELGFEDASYFNRFFKRMSGQTPIEYRNDIRKMYH